MTKEEAQNLLPLAAKACGRPDQYLSTRGCPTTEQEFAEKGWAIWQPNIDVEQCAEMNAALGHDTWWNEFNCQRVSVGTLREMCVEEHNGTTQDKLRAWMEASVRAAARIGEKK